jgi:hypothetical protein
LLLADRGGFPGEDQEGGLEGVLGVLFIVEDLPTDSKHQLAMPPKKRSEGLFVTALDESAEQFRVVLVAAFKSSENPDGAQNFR